MTTTQGPAPLSIVISEEAAHHVKEFAAAEGNSEADLRVGVKGGGCSGLTYILEIVNDGPRDTDKVIDETGCGFLLIKSLMCF